MSALPKRILLYVAALVAPILALLLRVVLERRYGELPHYVLFYPVVLLVAMLGGAWAGLLATATSAMLALYWVLPPKGRFEIAGTSDAIGLAIFCVMGVCFSVFAELYHRKQRVLETYKREVAVRKAQRKSEHALRESEARFRSFMDNSPAIAWMKDAQGRYVYLSKTHESLFGARLEDWRGKTDADVWPQDMARTYLEHDVGVLAANRPMQLVENSPKPDGSVVTLLVTKFPITTANGQRFVGGVGVDITERKRMEDALRESEARFRSFMDNGLAIAFIKDEQGRYVYVNKAVERFQPRVDRLGKTDAELWPEETARQFRENDLAVLKSGHSIEVVEEVINVDGSKSVWLTNKFPLSNATGERFVAGMGLDITERKRAEEALRESEERLRQLGDNLPNSAVFQYTYEPDGKPRFLYVSAGIERLHGVKAEDVLKDANVLQRLISPDELPAWWEAEKNSARKLSVFEREAQLRLPDGELRWIHVVSRPRPLPDGRVIWDGVVTDVTERKRAQEALLRSEKLAATGRLAATIAHEINNPLAAAMNAVYIASSIPAQAGEMLQLAERELGRAAHITQQTLGFYRDSGGQEQVAIPKLVEEVLTVYATKLRNRNITVQYRHRCSSSSPREGCPDGCKQCESYFRVNAGELRQIISNLLANGIDALSDGGTVYIRISRLSDRVQLTIADNGCGIRTENLKRIFEPFYTTKKDVGTGLGLWVTHELVRKHNGVIRVRSRRDKGTVFRLTFPQQTASGGQVSTATPTPLAKSA